MPLFLSITSLESDLLDACGRVEVAARIFNTMQRMPTSATTYDAVTQRCELAKLTLVKTLNTNERASSCNTCTKHVPSSRNTSMKYGKSSRGCQSDEVYERLHTIVVILQSRHATQTYTQTKDRKSAENSLHRWRRKLSISA